MEEKEKLASPVEALLKFLEGLPLMVRDKVFMACGIYLLGYGLSELHAARDDPKVYLDGIRDYLLPTGGDFLPVSFRRPAFRCAALVGVIEVALQPTGFSQEGLLELYEETGEESLQAAAFRSPLVERQEKVTLEQLGKLKEGVLSPQYLHLWGSFGAAEEPTNDIAGSDP